MAVEFLNFCDNCGCLTDIIFIEEMSGRELCEDCFNFIDDDFYDDDDDVYDI
jgi:hypothetical protein